MYVLTFNFFDTDNNTQLNSKKQLFESGKPDFDGGEYEYLGKLLCFVVNLVDSCSNHSKRILYSLNGSSVTWNDFLHEVNDQYSKILLYPHLCSISVHDVG